MQTNSANSTPTKGAQKGWKLPIIMCPCSPDDHTPDSIINRICMHPDCKNSLLYCGECIESELHEKLHSKSIYKIKDFLAECLKSYSSFQEDEFSFQEFSPDVLQLEAEREKLLDKYKVKINKEIELVHATFDQILLEIKSVLNDRREKLLNYIKKSFEICETTFTLFSQKLTQYNENWEFFKSKDFSLSQSVLNEQLNDVKSHEEMKEFIQKLSFIKNKLNTISDENFAKILLLSRILKRYMQTVPEMRPLPETKTKKLPLLDSLELKEAFISAHKKLTFQNNEHFQGICTEMMQCLDFEDQDFIGKLKTSFVEFEYFLNENKKSEDFAVTMPNHFVPSFNRPYLHYFHFNTKDLYLLSLPSSNQKSLSPEDCAFQKVTLDIDFLLPANNCSISTPDGRLFLNGGKGLLDKMYELNFETKRLIPRKSMKQKRWDHAICMCKGFIYVFGGADRDENYRLTKKCEKYDISLDAWIDITSFTTEASDFSVCSFNDKYIYKFGGWNSVSYINIIERYDIEFDQWTVINPPMKPMLGGFPECIQINERQIYVFGGFYIKGHDENFILEIEENDQDEWSSNYGMEKIKFPNKMVFPVRSQFKMPKNVLVHNGVVYTIYKNKEQSCLLGFDGKRWKILNENIYVNFSNGDA